MKNFVHLHTHSHYSLLDACVTIPQLLDKAVEYKMPALALTDHGNLFGAIEFYKEAKKRNIKAIFGCELYVALGDHTERKKIKGKKNYHHLVILARNQIGYQNLVQIASKAYTHGFYYRPRVDKAILREHHQGLIALSGCLSSETSQHILNDDKQNLMNTIKEYQDIFGKAYFFLEIQDHGIERQHKVNQALIQMANEHDIPLVATNDVHFLKQDDAEAHDVFICIGTQSKVSDKNRKRFEGNQFYFKNYDEMKKVFPAQEEAINNTLRIADMCEEYDLNFSQAMPSFQCPDGQTPKSYLKELCHEGLQHRYNPITEKIQNRLAHELDIICKMGFETYFLIVWDFIKWARENNIVVGPGRGSAAGSIVAYALYITNIDPLQYNLIFERFLNPARISMPDIDTDFQDEKRDQVIQYVIQKYGQDKVANIITFGSLKARGVIRDVGRVLDFPLSEVDKIAKFIPPTLGITLDKAYQNIPQLNQLINTNANYQKLFQIAKKLEGIYRHVGTHAAGIIISPTPLSKSVPLYVDPKTKQVSTQYEGSHLELCGLLKMDFLGLKNLSVIQRCIQLIHQEHNVLIDINQIPLDSKKTYKLLQQGHALGVFQLESSGMRQLMKKLKPCQFEDLIALIALYRPGPINSGMTREFIQRKNNPARVQYIHPLLKDILKGTYGVIIYQEQVMQIARTIGQFSMAKADELRKAMGKKLVDKMKSMQIEFVNGATKNKLSDQESNTLYEQMSKFGEYGFNKSHSAAYAMITYQTAYLKSNYPVEYMTALLSYEKDNAEKLAEYIYESQRMNIILLSPSINHSQLDFSVEKGADSSHKIRFGLLAIKNIGSAAVQSIVDEQKNGIFKSLSDFCMRIDLRTVNKKAIECLIKSGAFDNIDKNRHGLFSIMESAIESSQEAKEQAEHGQFSLFDQEDSSDHKQQIEHISITKTNNWEFIEKLNYEKEMLGVYLSGHPLKPYQSKMKQLGASSIEDLKHITQTDAFVSFCGWIDDVQIKVSKKGSQWGQLSMVGLINSCEVMLFKDVLSKSQHFLKTNSVFYVQGKIQSKESKPKIIAHWLAPINQVNKETIPQYKNNNNSYENPTMNNNSTQPDSTGILAKENEPGFYFSAEANLHIHLDQSIQEGSLVLLNEIKQILMHYPGNSFVFFHLDGHANSKIIQVGKNFNICVTEELLQEIKNNSSIQNKWMSKLNSHQSNPHLYITSNGR